MDENIKIDDEAVLTLLNKIKFDFKERKETYQKESLISDYINNLFIKLDKTKEYFEKSKKQVENYIDNFINVPTPKTVDASLSNINSLQAVISSNENKINAYEKENDDKVLSTIKNGEQVNVLEYLNDSKYTKVELKNGKVVYVEKKSISLE